MDQEQPIVSYAKPSLPDMRVHWLKRHRVLREILWGLGAFLALGGGSLLFLFLSLMFTRDRGQKHGNGVWLILIAIPALMVVTGIVLLVWDWKYFDGEGSGRRI